MVKKYKAHLTKVNESEVANIVNREFNERDDYEVLVSDLTYVRVKGDWNYICLILNLHNREIVRYAAEIHKDALLVYQALSSININLNTVKIFYSNSGREFNNYRIDDLLKVFNIERSLSHKGCLYENTVAEATFKIIKVEFFRYRYFNSIKHLKSELDDYVYWFNHKRIHGSFGYMSPMIIRNLC